MAWETWVQSQVKSYQRLKKWFLMLPCLTLSIIRYGSRVKWSNPGKELVPTPTPWCSSYRKWSLRVTLNYGRQIYLLSNTNNTTGYAFKRFNLSSSLWIKFFIVWKFLKIMLTHKKEKLKPYSHEVWGLTYSCGLYLKSLMTINWGKKRCMCAECGLAFSESSSLECHKHKLRRNPILGKFIDQYIQLLIEGSAFSFNST